MGLEKSVCKWRCWSRSEGSYSTSARYYGRPVADLLWEERVELQGWILVLDEGTWLLCLVGQTTARLFIEVVEREATAISRTWPALLGSNFFPFQNHGAQVSWERDLWMTLWNDGGEHANSC